MLLTIKNETKLFEIEEMHQHWEDTVIQLNNTCTNKVNLLGFPCEFLQNKNFQDSQITCRSQRHKDDDINKSNDHGKVTDYDRPLGPFLGQSIQTLTVVQLGLPGLSVGIGSYTQAEYHTNVRHAQHLVEGLPRPWGQVVLGDLLHQVGYSYGGLSVRIFCSVAIGRFYCVSMHGIGIFLGGPSFQK